MTPHEPEPSPPPEPPPTPIPEWDEGSDLYGAITDALGPESTGIVYSHPARDAAMPTIVHADVPRIGVTTHVTFGLYRHPMPNQNGVRSPRSTVLGSEVPQNITRIELVGACKTTVPDFGRLLARAAFHLIDAPRPCPPGTVLENVILEVGLQGVQTTLLHLWLVEPTSWEGRFTPLRLPNFSVTFLQAIPIADGELTLLRRDGAAALRARLTDADLFDPSRRSAA